LKSFKTTFKEDNHLIRKLYAVGIEGNNYKLRHRKKNELFVELVVFLRSDLIILKPLL